MTKRLLTLLFMACLATAATAQGTVKDLCETPAPKLPKKERIEKQRYLEALLDDWKKIGASGNAPAIAFEDLDKSRLLVSATYDLDDSSAAHMLEDYDFVRVATLHDVAGRLSDIFGLVTELGYDILIKMRTSPAQQQPAALFAYSNASARRIMTIGTMVEASLYSNMVHTRKELPFEFDDSLMCTGIGYCGNLYTIRLHSLVNLGTPAEADMEWKLFLTGIVEGYELCRYIGMDGTTLRFIVSMEGSADTLTYDYTPAQLLGEAPVLDVDEMGRYLAHSIDRECPIPLVDAEGNITKAEYDGALHLVVMHLSVPELTVLNTEGREDQMKYTILDAMLQTEDAEDFFDLFLQASLGLELRMRSRTTGRTSTLTYTPDELRLNIPQD